MFFKQIIKKKSLITILTIILCFCMIAHFKEIKRNFFSIVMTNRKTSIDFTNVIYRNLFLIKKFKKNAKKIYLENIELQTQIIFKKTREPYLNNLMNIRIIKIEVQKNKFKNANLISKKRLNHQWIFKKIFYEELGNLCFLENNKTQAIKFWKKSFILERNKKNKIFQCLKIEC